MVLTVRHCKIALTHQSARIGLGDGINVFNLINRVCPRLLVDMLALTRRPARIGMSDGIHVFGRNDIRPRVPSPVRNTSGIITPRTVLERLRPAVAKGPPSSLATTSPPMAVSPSRRSKTTPPIGRTVLSSVIVSASLVRIIWSSLV